MKPPNIASIIAIDRLSLSIVTAVAGITAACPETGAPQLGHDRALSETCLSHSLQFIKAMLFLR